MGQVESFRLASDFVETFTPSVLNKNLLPLGGGNLNFTLKALGY